MIVAILLVYDVINLHSANLPTVIFPMSRQHSAQSITLPKYC